MNYVRSLAPSRLAISRLVSPRGNQSAPVEISDATTALALDPSLARLATVRPAGEPAGEGQRPVWFSLDPRSGEVSAYPQPVNERLETCWLSGGDREVRLVGFGGVFENIVVDLGGGDMLPSQRNTRTGGKRDVRRLGVPEEQMEICVHVKQDRGWRMAEEAVVDQTEERTLRLHGGSLASGEDHVNWPRRSGVDLAAERELRLATAGACDRAGLVGLWEWCRIPAADPDSVPADMWGVYGHEQDCAIELAFRAGSPSVQITVGIRNYEISFFGASYGKQEDKKARKRRLVRRQMVSEEKRRDALTGVVASEMADGECGICCESFSDTLAVPVVRLPGCGHSFHGACVQHIADKRGPCPFCRAKVDWRNAMMPQAHAGPLVIGEKVQVHVSEVMEERTTEPGEDLTMTPSVTSLERAFPVIVSL